MALAEINRATHPPVIFQTSVHIIAHWYPIGWSKSHGQVKIQGIGRCMRLLQGNRCIILSQNSEEFRPLFRFTTSSYMPFPFHAQGWFLLCPVLIAFHGFSHVILTPQSSLSSSGSIRLKFWNSSHESALPDHSSLTVVYLFGQCVCCCYTTLFQLDEQVEDLSNISLICTPWSTNTRLHHSSFPLYCNCWCTCLSSHWTVSSLNGTVPFISASSTKEPEHILDKWMDDRSLPHYCAKHVV